MARELSTTDNTDAVNRDFLLATFEGGDAPASEDPVMQKISDVVHGHYLIEGALPDPLTEAHVGNTYNVGGHLLNIRRQHFDGLLAVTWTDYADASDVSSLWNEPAGTYRFRGIAARGNVIPGPSDGDVYVNYGGGFLRYNVTGGNIGWVHLSHPDGWGGVRDTQAEAEHEVTGNNEIWAWGNELHLSSAYSRTGATTSIISVDITENGSPDIALFWGSGQAEAVPQDAIDRALTNGNFYRYEFESETPNEIMTGHDPGVRCVDASDVSDANLLSTTAGGTTTTEALGDQRVFLFPPGSYTIRLFAAHKQSADTTLESWIYQVMSGEDDIRMNVGGAYVTSVLDPLGNITANADDVDQVFDIELDFKTAADLYLTFIAGTFGSAGTVDSVHYLKVIRWP